MAPRFGQYNYYLVVMKDFLFKYRYDLMRILFLVAVSPLSPYKLRKEIAPLS